MARISGVDLPREKRIEIGLTYIYGIGRVHVGQYDFERIGRCFNAGLHGAVFVQLKNTANAGAVAFNQTQTVEYFRQLLISRLRNANTNIFGGKTGKKSAKRDELHLAVVHVNNDAAAETVITVNKSVQQRFTDGFFGVVLLIRADNAFDRGSSLVAQRKVVYCILKLVEHRTAEFFAVTELRTKFIFEYGDFGCVMALVGKQQSEVSVNIVLRDTQRTVLLDGKLHTVAPECRIGSIKG